MAAKGHPWLFLRYTVLSDRMVRWPLEYLQRPMHSGNSASYTSVLYIFSVGDAFLVNSPARQLCLHRD